MIFFVLYSNYRHSSIKQGLQIFFLIFLLALSGIATALQRIEVHGLFKDKAVVSLDEKRRILKVGEMSPEGALLISANSKEAVLEIDGVKKTYKLSANISSRFSKAAAGPSTTIAPDSRGIYRLNGLVNGVKVNFIVDTGATLVSINSVTAERIGLDYQLVGKPSLSSTASGLAKIYIVDLKWVQIGSIKLKNVKAAIHEGSFPVDVLLGMSFLSRLDMQREGSLLRLQRKN